MNCTDCGIWELAEGDLVCGWCGTSYLRYTVGVDAAELSADDYPPPLALRVHNDSPMGTLTVDNIQAAAPWINLLPNQPLLQTVAPGTEHRFFLEVDTFAAGVQTEAVIRVSALYAAEAKTITLHLRHPAPPSP